MMINKTMQYPVLVVKSRLAANREKHITEYELAMQGYNAERSKLYATLAYKLRQDGDTVPDNDFKAIDAAYEAAQDAWRKLHMLVRPESHLDDYDRAIDMLACCSETDVEMDGQTFDQYMRDEWKWKQAFTAATKSYIASGK